MRIIDPIKAASRGATFLRADLHIHSFGKEGSYDVKDEKLTPANIVREAKRLGIKILAITDHNSYGNVQATVDEGASCGVFVVPGVELSTPAGHLLVYAETVMVLARIVSSLSFSADKRACRTSASDVLDLTSRYGGIAICAHIDVESGIEYEIPGYGDVKTSVLCSPALMAIEIAKKANLSLYSLQDANVERRNILYNRFSTIGDPFTKSIARIQSSDAHDMISLGKNWEREEKLTRLKMSDLCWTAFRTAFEDSEARVRVENSIPILVPQFYGMLLKGGFLSEQIFSFSPNLTCIIGGRGSGKSTAFQVLRKFCGRTPTEDLCGSEVWPETAVLVYHDEMNRECILRFDGEGDVYLVDSDEPVPFMDIECLQQGETARTIERCGKDPTSLLAFLDQLIEFKDLHDRVEKQLERLSKNDLELTEIERALQTYDETNRSLQSKKTQQDSAKAANSERLIVLQRDLANAIQARKEIVGEYDCFGKELLSGFDSFSMDAFDEMADKAKGISEKDIQDPFPAIGQRLRDLLRQSKQQLTNLLRESKQDVSTFVSQCRLKQEEIQKETAIEEERLRKMGINLNTKFLNQLAIEVGRLEQKLRSLERQKTRYQELLRDRKGLFQQYQALQTEKYQRRIGLAIKLTEKLRDFLVDWKISLKFCEGGLSSEAETVIKDQMEWRTSNISKAQRIVRALGVPKLIEAIESNNASLIAEVKNPDGSGVFGNREVADILRRLAEPQVRRKIEGCRYEDIPKITVSRQQQAENAAKEHRPQVQDFSRLSLGQQQSIILAILLSVESNRPLLIDQPEDNLDSAFIFQILVRALRRIKETRQVILVTHNANIAVLSDTDQVIPLKATAEKAIVMGSGTVESPTVKGLVCEILEGGTAAYLRRGKLYGFSG